MNEMHSVEGVSQEYLVKIVRSIFPRDVTLVDSRKQSSIKFPNGAYVELDVWIPEYKICFEFQDLYHYATTWYSQAPVDRVQSMDTYKNIMVRKAGLDLIIVPYWWDGSIEQLSATIKFQRPDIGLTHSSQEDINLTNHLSHHDNLPNRSSRGAIDMLTNQPSPEDINMINHRSLEDINMTHYPSLDDINTTHQPSPEDLNMTHYPSLDDINMTNHTSPEDINMTHHPSLEDASLVQLSSIQARPRAHVPPAIYDLPIQLNAPHSYLSGTVPWIGELMLAKFPDYNARDALPLNWWVGEKYDGLRCCWNPNVRLVYTRNGKVLPLLPNLIGALPDIYLDAEIWFGRGDFGHVQHLLMQQEAINWHMLRINAFDVPFVDIPSLVVRSLPIEHRYAILLKYTTEYMPLVTVVARITCNLQPSLTNTSSCDMFLPPNVTRQHDLSNYPGSYSQQLSPRHLVHQSRSPHSLLHQVLDHGGEGIILQQPASLYVHGRSASLLKVKGSQEDKEAVVIGKAARSIVLKMADGVMLSVPVNNVLVPASLSIGDVVTFSYERYARKEFFINPTIYRLRTDLSWEDVMRPEHKPETLYKSVVQPQEYKKKTSQRLWTQAAMRSFLEDIAKKHSLDPLLPATWRRLSATAIILEGGKTILEYHKGYFNMLQSLFPEINLTGNIGIRGNDVASRRKIFEHYAEFHGFDPQIPENWYQQPKEKIFAFHGARSILSHYKDNIPKALLNIFPDIGLDKSEFAGTTKQRIFLENYAKEHGFDFLVPENWYKLSSQQILSAKGALGVMENSDVNSVIIKAFKDISIALDGPHLSSLRQQHKQRQVFEMFAKENSFDPYNANDWYKQSREKLLRVRGIQTIIKHYKNSLSEALTTLFPRIGLDKAKLLRRTPTRPL